MPSHIGKHIPNNAVYQNISLFYMILLYSSTGSLDQQLECSLMARKTGFQSQVKSYQRLKKWYLMPPYLTLSITRYESRVKWSNPGKEQRPPLHLSVVAIKKGAFGSPSTTVANFILVLFQACCHFVQKNWIWASRQCMEF